MSVVNPRSVEKKRVPICLNIPWDEDRAVMRNNWRMGMTGFFRIGAAMRQFFSEGWIHHARRNAVSM